MRLFRGSRDDQEGHSAERAPSRAPPTHEEAVEDQRARRAPTSVRQGLRRTAATSSARGQGRLAAGVPAAFSTSTTESNTPPATRITDQARIAAARSLGRDMLATEGADHARPCRPPHNRRTVPRSCDRRDHGRESERLGPRAPALDGGYEERENGRVDADFIRIHKAYDDVTLRAD